MIALASPFCTTSRRRALLYTRYQEEVAARELGLRDSLERCDTTLVGDAEGKALEVLVALAHGLTVATERSIGGGQLEHRLPGFLGQRHQAAVVLQGGEAVRIGRDRRRRLATVADGNGCTS